jgi:dTDP-glucose 4,6-dehydratase
VSRVLVTGGAGFIGSAVVRCLVEAGWSVVVLDRLTYAGRREHLAGVDCELQVGDVCDPAAAGRAAQGVDAVLHLAAESHVTRSLAGPEDFLHTNVTGTRVMLEAALGLGVPRFLHMSTDEVFGAAPDGVRFGPDDAHRPGNPYAASKVGAEALVHAWRHSFGYPAAIVRCTNNYGPRQHPEKAVPSWSLAALDGGPVPVHGMGAAVRDWLHVEDLARGLLLALERWRPGATWHFAGQQPLMNREMAGRVLREVGRQAGRAPAAMEFGEERQGQDHRYALDDAATRAELGWAPQVGLDEGLAQVVAWYREHRHLWG